MRENKVRDALAPYVGDLTEDQWEELSGELFDAVSYEVGSRLRDIYPETMGLWGKPQVREPLGKALLPDDEGGYDDNPLHECLFYGLWLSEN